MRRKVMRMAMTRRRSTQHVNTAKKLLIHIGDVGGDPMLCVGPAIKRVMWRRYAKESNKGHKLLKRPMTRRRSAVLCRLALLITSLVKHG